MCFLIGLLKQIEGPGIDVFIPFTSARTPPPFLPVLGACQPGGWAPPLAPGGTGASIAFVQAAELCFFRGDLVSVEGNPPQARGFL